MDFNLKSIQTALFIKEFDVDKANIYNFPNEIKSYSSIFDGDPFFTNVPSDAPKDIPRLILKSKDDRYNCNISLNRVDLFQNNLKKDLSLEEQKEAIKSIFNFLEKKKITINRVGFIGNFLTIIEEQTSAEYINSEFIKEDALKNPRELIINYSKRTKQEEINFNVFLRLLGKNEKNLNLQIDVNTIQEDMETNVFNERDFFNILDYSVKEIEKIKNEFPIINI
jgi:hypothetical protein